MQLIKLVNRLGCIFVTLIPFSAFSETILLPIISHDGRVYLATQFEVVDKKDVKDKYQMAVKESQRFLSAMKGGGVSDFTKYFTGRDGSIERLSSKSFNFIPSGFNKITRVEYLSPILRENYLHIPTEYFFGEKSLKWREDFLCDKSCERSVADFGQVFELSYQFYIKKQKQTIKGRMADVGAWSSMSKVASIESPLDDTVKNKPDMQLGINLAKIIGENCVGCDPKDNTGSFEKKLLGKLRSFVTEVKGLPDNVTDEKVINVIRKYSRNFNKNKAIPLVRWKGNIPKLVHVNYLEYLNGWLNYSGGIIEGYMLESDYAYLFVSKSETNEEVSNKTYQIFILQHDGKGDYFLHPQADKKLRSRTLIFNHDVLRIIDNLFFQRPLS